MVGHETLDLGVLVRIQVGQYFDSAVPASLSTSPFERCWAAEFFIRPRRSTLSERSESKGEVEPRLVIENILTVSLLFS